MPRGVKIKELGGADRRFKDLYELLANYKDHLVAPYESDLPKQPWYDFFVALGLVLLADLLEGSMET